MFAVPPRGLRLLGLTAAVQTETFACRSYDPVSERTMESARMLYGSTPTVVTFGRGISNLAAYVQRHNQHVALRQSGHRADNLPRRVIKV